MVCDAVHVLRCELKSLQRHAGQAGLSSTDKKWCAPSQIFKHIPGTQEYPERERPAPTNNPFSQHLQSLCDLYTGPAVSMLAQAEQVYLLCVFTMCDWVGCGS